MRGQYVVQLIFASAGPINELQEEKKVQFVICLFSLCLPVCVSIYGANLQCTQHVLVFLLSLCHPFTRSVSHTLSLLIRLIVTGCFQDVAMKLHQVGNKRTLLLQRD